jgi:hypothetical protein
MKLMVSQIAWGDGKQYSNIEIHRIGLIPNEFTSQSCDIFVHIALFCQQMMP